MGAIKYFLFSAAIFNFSFQTAFAATFSYPIPGHIKTRIIQSANILLGEGQSDDQLSTQDAVEGVDWLKAMGTPHHEILEKASKHLRRVWNRDRLSCHVVLTSIPEVKLRTNRLPGTPLLSYNGNQMEISLLEKYDFDSLKKFTDELWATSNKNREWRGSRHDIDMIMRLDALNLGFSDRMKIEDLAEELFAPLLRSRDFKAAREFVEKFSNNQKVLKTICLMAILDFLTRERAFFGNTLWDINEAYKRTEGETKEYLTPLIFDFATMLSSKEFAEFTGMDPEQNVYQEYALRLIVSTGTVVRKEKDFDKMIFHTTLTNPTYKQAAIDLIKSLEWKISDHDFILSAKASVGDFSEANEIAEEHFTKRSKIREFSTNTDRYADALKYFELARNKEGMIRTIKAAFTEKSLIRHLDFEENFSRLAVELLGEEGKQMAIAFANKKIQALDKDTDMYETSKKRLLHPKKEESYSRATSEFERALHGILYDLENPNTQAANPNSTDFWDTYLAVRKTMNAQALIDLGDSVLRRERFQRDPSRSPIDALEAYAAAAVILMLQNKSL